VAAGPMSEPIIHAMWASNPMNMYIDFGSSLDPVTKQKNTRLYHSPTFPKEGFTECKRWGLDSERNPILHPHEEVDYYCIL